MDELFPGPGRPWSARHRTWVTVLTGLCLLVLSLLATSHATAQTCQFRLGFKTLHDLIPDVVGDCLEDEHYNPANGDSLQRTTGGLLVWRKADNWTAFTDGATTWINGPGGLQLRPNDLRFCWEADADPSACTYSTLLVPLSQPMATPRQSGLATVVSIASPEVLNVRNRAGQEFSVWHVGIIGPAESQGDWRLRATRYHMSLVSPGTSVWIEVQDGLRSPGSSVVLAHVWRAEEYLSGTPSRTVAADLLRAGFVWVYPHSAHALAPDYASLQAQAVLARSGLWAETRSTAIYLPKGERFGGFPINPSVRPALEALDATEMGHALLKYLNLFPVEIGVSRGPSRSAIGYFQARYYTIQLSPSIMAAPARSIAAVLVHELVHARQMVEQAVEGRELDCYGQEEEAFKATAVFWLSLYGPGGKQPPTHALDAEVNQVLKDYLDNQLAARVRESYHQECAA